MEPGPELAELPSSGLSRSEVTTAHDEWVTDILRTAALSLPHKIPTLMKRSDRDFQPSLPSNSDAAQCLLVQQRKSEPGYRSPEQQSRHKFRSKERKEELSNEDKWVFTKHVVAKAFDGLLSRTPLAPPGIAQALLSKTSVSSLEELWCHLHDPKLEKRMTSRFRRSRSSVFSEITWLDEVTSQENLDYVSLLCQAGLARDSLDRAFSIALSKHSMDVMEILLCFGANASVCQDAIRERVRLHDSGLVRLLLSVQNAMSLEAWRNCIEPQVESLRADGKGSPTILLMCLAHRPNVICGTLLLKALESENLQATAIILAYANLDQLHDTRHHACVLASRITDDEQRYQFFTLLGKAGFITDGPVLREELMKDVKARQIPLIQRLVDADVSLDIEPYNAFHWAVSHMELDILDLFKSGTFSSPVSLALNKIPDSTSESAMLRLVEMFAPMGLVGEPLDSHLVRAVQKQHIKLVGTLLHHGASVEFKKALAVQKALEKTDFDILNILLQKKLSRESLSATIPTAMLLQPRFSRLLAMNALLGKGVLERELGIPLQRLVSEDGHLDFELIQLLLQHNAPVDGVGDDANNAVLVATRRGNLPVLKLLCDAGPRSETLSKAVRIAFGTMNTWGYDVVLSMIKLLVKNGASGLSTHQTLLAAAKQDSRLDIVRLLIENGAEANFENGASFAVAIETANLNLLKILCAGCPPSRSSIESILFTATNPRYYNQQALEILLDSTTSAAPALNASWVSEKFKGNDNMTAIIPCFLRHGLNVDLGNGVLLCFAIQERNAILLDHILSANPTIASLTTAFQAAISVKPRIVELETMRLLLEKAESAEIGQSRSLLQQTYAALNGDLTGLQLLLRHKAVVDFDSGKAVQAAASAGSLEILDLLLLSKPVEFTLHKACLAAANSTISWGQKQNVFEHLLGTNARPSVSAAGLSEVLADSVASLPGHAQLPQLLLARGAEVNLEILKVALEKTSLKTFTYARKIAMAPERRYWIYHYLLDRAIPSNEVSEALLDSLKAGDLGNLSLLKLLLEHGAAAEYKNGAAFSLACDANSPQAVKLLTQYIVDDSIAGVAFDLASKANSLDPHSRLEVYRCLLQWQISQSSIHDALLKDLKAVHSDTSTVQLLLANGADPNKDNALCFLVAARAGAETKFRALGKYAKLRMVLQALLSHFREERQVVWWFDICLEERPYHDFAEIDQDGLLFECMRVFPQGTTLLNLLFDNGLSTTPEATRILHTGWRPERCTALIWSLFSKPRIANEVILELLARGGDAAPLTYSTPLTKVSAAFACLLDKKRTPVLKALLILNKEGLLDYKVPKSSFNHLAADPKVPAKDSDLEDLPDELPLPVAAMYLGNFDAFRLLRGEDVPDDETLHSVALLALPKFVEHLLETHDPNCKSEKMDSMIPLALACQSEPQPWCKIANEESGWKARQKATMQVLASRTDLKWRYRGKTVLHYAFDNKADALGATKSILDVLRVREDPEKDDRFIYKDRDGIEYSPHQLPLRLWIEVSLLQKDLSQ